MLDSKRIAPALAGLLSACLLSTPLGAGTPPQDSEVVASTVSTQSIDREFRCPEALANSERLTELADFMAKAALAMPSDGLADALAFRRRLLERHHCAESLAKLDAADRAIDAGDVGRQAWLPLARDPDEAVDVSASYLKPFIDPRFPSTRSIETFGRVRFAKKREITPAQAYDTIVSHVVFYCKINSYALIENDFFDGNTVVQRIREKPNKTDHGLELFALKPVPDASPNFVIGKWACQNLKNYSAA